MSIVDVSEDHPEGCEAHPRMCSEVPECLAQVREEISEGDPPPDIPNLVDGVRSNLPIRRRDPARCRRQATRPLSGSHGVKLSQFRLNSGWINSRRTPGPRRRISPTGKSTSSARIATSIETTTTGSIHGCQRFLNSLQAFRSSNGTAKAGDRTFGHMCPIRASGVRIQEPSSSPSLVAMTTTQVPIIAWQRRYMTRTNVRISKALAS